jgi:hypothetical protein
VKLAKLQEDSDPNNGHEEKELREEINVMLEQEKLKWRQRAKENWLRNGDRNTKYLYA